MASVEFDEVKEQFTVAVDEQVFFEGQSVDALVSIEKDMFIVGIYNKKLQVFDRDLGKTLLEIETEAYSKTGEYFFSSIQKILGYDYETNPYVLIKDKESIWFLHIRTF